MFVWPTLKKGDRGAEVGNLQRFLTDQGRTDTFGGAVAIDEMFGARTEQAVRSFQADHDLMSDGIFGPRSRVVAKARGFVPFVQALNATLLYPRRKTNTLLVIHSAECAESSFEAAENNALWAAGKLIAKPPNASWHYFVDRDSVVQSVREGDKAWHCQSDKFDTINNRAIGIEHSGYARQNAAEWSDEVSTAILARSAELGAAIASRYAIPIRKLTPLQVRAGEAGFCGHVDVSLAYAVPSGHFDPGPSFPWDRYLERVRSAL